MIKKKKSSVSYDQALEDAVGKRFVDKYKYIVLNTFVTHMRLHYDLSYTNKKAVEFLKRIGLKRKRIAFDTVDGIKHSKNEFINEHGLLKLKPKITPPTTHGEAINIVALLVLDFIRKNFNTLVMAEGLINFNMYEEENEGLILVYDNQTLRAVLEKISNNFSYGVNFISSVASEIKSISEPAYLRENVYGENKNRILEKKFYVYRYDEKLNETKGE